VADADHMIRKQLHRPSLKITRRADQRPAHRLTFEVWNPFTGNYQVEIRSRLQCCVSITWLD
jgi:hypothetical protein